MSRRAFVTGLGAVLAAPLAVEGQQAGKIYRIGFLRYFACHDELGLKDLRQKLYELGYVEGRSIVIECRAAPGKSEQLTDLATELVRLNVNVIVTEGTPPSQAAKQVTRILPIVMVYIGDPVASGLIGSLGRPGGNITGVPASFANIRRQKGDLA